MRCSSIFAIASSEVTTPQILVKYILKGKLQLALVVYDGTISEAIELSNILPGLSVVGMEDMYAVDVDIDAFHVFYIDIAADI